MGRLRAVRRVCVGFGVGALLGWLTGLTSKMKSPQA